MVRILIASGSPAMRSSVVLRVALFLEGVSRATFDQASSRISTALNLSPSSIERLAPPPVLTWVT